MAGIVKNNLENPKKSANKISSFLVLCGYSLPYLPPVLKIWSSFDGIKNTGGKMIFLRHLYHLEESSLARKVIHIQTSNGLPGIVEECNEKIDYEKFSNDSFNRKS